MEPLDMCAEPFLCGSSDPELEPGKPLFPLHLGQMEPGSCCRITAVDGAAELERLKSMGLCIGRTLEVVKAGDPLIVKVYGTRIGLSARLAAQVQVVACAASPRCWQQGFSPVEAPHGL